MRHPRVTIAGLGFAAVAAAGGINVASASGPPAGTAAARAGRGAGY